MTTFFQWLGKHPNLIIFGAMGFASLGSVLMAHVLVDFVTETPLDTKARFLVQLVTGSVLALGTAVGFGVLLGRYGKKP